MNRSRQILALSVPSINDILFNPSSLEDFLIENKQNRPAIFLLLRSIAHDLFQQRAGKSLVNDHIVSICSQIVCSFDLTFEELSRENLPFSLMSLVYRNLASKLPRFSSDLFRLCLKEGVEDSFTQEKWKEFWENPEAVKNDPLFEDVVLHVTTHEKDRRKLNKLFAVRKTSRLLEIMQNDQLLIESFLSQPAESTEGEYSAKEKEILFQNIIDGSCSGKIDSFILKFSSLKGKFSAKCLLAALFVKLIVGEVNFAEHYTLIVNNSEVFFSLLNVFSTKKAQEIMENFSFQSLFPQISSPNHTFLFYSLAYSIGWLDKIESLQTMTHAIHQKLLSKAGSNQKPLLSGLLYERFNYDVFMDKQQNTLKLAMEDLWNQMNSFKESLGPISSVEELSSHVAGLTNHQIVLLILLYGADYLQKKDYSKAFNFAYTALQYSMEELPFSSVKFTKFCKNLLFELCFVFVNELQSEKFLKAALTAIKLLQDQIPSDPSRIIFFTANLINRGKISFAIEQSKVFLSLAGRNLQNASAGTSLIKLLYHSSICISLFLDSSLENEFANWSPKSISILVAASDSLFRLLSQDGDLLNIFIMFLSLLHDREVFLKDFVGLFLGNLNDSIRNGHAICLKYFSKYSCFNGNSTNQKYCKFAAISECNDSLNLSFRPNPNRGQYAAAFSSDSLRKVIIGLWEKPSNPEYFSTLDCLAYAEILFLTEEFETCVAVLLYFMMMNSKSFLKLEFIEDLSLILERIASCLFELGDFFNLVLLSQMLDIRSAFWLIGECIRLDMLEKEIIPFIWDGKIAEFLAANCSQSRSDFQSLMKQHISKEIGFPNAKVLEIRLLKKLCIEYFF